MRRNTWLQQISAVFRSKFPYSSPKGLSAVGAEDKTSFLGAGIISEIAVSISSSHSVPIQFIFTRDTGEGATVPMGKTLEQWATLIGILGRAGRWSGDLWIFMTLDATNWNLSATKTCENNCRREKWESPLNSTETNQVRRASVESFVDI